MTSPTTDLAGDLRSTFSGPLVTPEDAEFDEVRRIHNGLIDKRPALIARCRGTDDVVAAVNFGRERGLEISVRAGGHNSAGRAVTEGGLMIDLALMKDVGIDTAARTIRAGGGATWGELNDAAHAVGLATTGGVVSSTGIAGLTLGGGIGWIQSKYGLAVDNLLSAEVVLASGEVVTASEDADSDLFWAIRGGGGNFGVVTSFEFRAYPLDTVLGGILAHPLEAGIDLVRFYREFMQTASDDLQVYLGFVHAPDGSGTKLTALVVCHCGDAAAADAETKPLREFGPPIMDTIDRIPYPVQNTLFDPGYPRGARNYWRSAFFPDIPDDAAHVMTRALEAAPHPLCGMAFEHFHGAPTRVPSTATAFPNREVGLNLILTGVWEDAAMDDEGIAWTKNSFNALRPFMEDRVYVNYLEQDESERVRQAYGPNYDRLVELKRRYDPDNLFRLNMNVTP